ncbi:hypothetical protein D3C76_887930 [compost metagenome]
MHSRCRVYAFVDGARGTGTVDAAHAPGDIVRLDTQLADSEGLLLPGLDDRRQRIEGEGGFFRVDLSGQKQVARQSGLYQLQGVAFGE